MKVRNVSGGGRFVPVLDAEVAAGEVAEVPEFQADGVSPLDWDQPGIWEIVAEAPVKPEKAAKTVKADG